MAKRKASIRFDGSIHWIDLPTAASLIGLTKKELQAKADLDEIRSERDKYDRPVWFAEPEIAALRKVHLAELRDRSARSALRAPRTKTAKQQEAEWAKAYGGAEPRLRDGPFTSLHLKLTLPKEEDGGA